MKKKISYLRALRQNLGLSLFAVGSQCGIRENRLSELELRKFIAYPRYRKALAQFFHETENNLFDKEGFAREWSQTNE